MFAGALFIKYAMGFSGDTGLYVSILILLAIAGFFCISGGLTGFEFVAIFKGRRWGGSMGAILPISFDKR